MVQARAELPRRPEPARRRSSARPRSPRATSSSRSAAGRGCSPSGSRSSPRSVHVVELDERLRPRLEPVAAARPGVELHLGRRDALRPRRPRPGADGDRRQPALRDRHPADPADDRRAADARALDGDGPARDRRPACERGPGSKLYGAPERARPARLRGEDVAPRRSRRVHAAPAGRLGAAAPAPHGSRRRPVDVGGGPRGLLPPPQDAARSLELAGVSERARSRAVARRARAGRERARRGARLPPSSSGSRSALR